MPVPVTAIINAIITIASITYSIASRPSRKDRRKRGNAFEFIENPDDPNTPIVIAYGKPTWVMSRLMRFGRPESINGRKFSRSNQRVIVFSAGFSGPGGLDAGDFELYRNDQKMFSVVDADTDINARKLIPQTSENKIYDFPNTWVQPTTVTVFKDGVVIGVGGNTPTVIGDADSFDVVSNKRAALIQVTRPGGSGFYVDDDAGGRRYGFLLPSQGQIIEGSMTVNAVQKVPVPLSLQGIGPYYVKTRNGKGLRNSVYVVPAKDIHFGELNDDTKQEYVWIDFTHVTIQTSQDPSTQPVISHFIVTYRVQKTFKIEVDPVDGASTLIFSEPQGSEEFTALYRHANSGSVRWTFRNGDENQGALPVKALKNTFLLGSVLDVGAAVTYSTTNKVNDVLVGIHTGPEGFYNLDISDGDYRKSRRSFQIRVKESDAPSAPTSSADPSLGWVTVLSKDTGTAEFRINDAVQGVGKMFQSLADHLIFTQERKTGVVNVQALLAGRGMLPLRRYDVEVTALEQDGIDQWTGHRNLGRIKNKIFYGDATEIAYRQVRLAGHATVTIEEDDPEELEGSSVWALGMRARRCWVPEATAVANADTGRPEPGNYEWTRNPVHIAVDLIRIERHSAGDFYTWSDIDLASWLSASAFCDEQVTNADGTTETRAEFDGIIFERDDLDAHVAQILAASQVLPIQSGGIWKFIKDVDAASVMALGDETDIRVSEISLTHASAEEIPDVLDVSYTPEELDGELDHYKVRLKTEPAQPRVRSVDYTGVRRLSQVVRVGSQQLLAMRRNKLTVALTAAGWRALQLEVGDIVTLTSVRLAFTTKLFRISKVEWGGALDVGLEMVEHDPTVYDAADRVVHANPVVNSVPAFVADNAAHTEALGTSKLSLTHVSGGFLDIDVGDVVGVK